MQTRTLCLYSTDRGMAFSVMGYSKEEEAEPVVQIAFGANGINGGMFFSPAEARQIAAALDAAATAAELPE